MNALEKGQLASTTIECFSDAHGSLSNFPGLIKRVIEEEAWKERAYRGRTYRLPSFRALVTEKPLAGWGQNPRIMEAVLRDYPEALEMFRQAMKRQGERTDFCNNITEVQDQKTGTSKAYRLSRLKRERPDLFESVTKGELSCHAACKEAGWVKPRKCPNCGHTIG